MWLYVSSWELPKSLWTTPYPKPPFSWCLTSRWQAEVQKPCPQPSAEGEELPRDPPWHCSLKLMKFYCFQMSCLCPECPVMFIKPLQKIGIGNQRDKAQFGVCEWLQKPGARRWEQGVIMCWATAGAGSTEGEAAPCCPPTSRLLQGCAIQTAKTWGGFASDFWHLLLPWLAAIVGTVASCQT